MTRQATNNIKAEHTEGLLCNHGMSHKQELVANVYDAASDQVEESLDEPNTTAGKPTLYELESKFSIAALEAVYSSVLHVVTES